MQYKILLFTSGTTSNSKGVMLCNRNLAENINSVSAYVHLTEEDRLLAYGKALLGACEIKQFETGQAIKTRKGMKK